MKTNLFFVGPGRSGTSWLFDVMAQTQRVQVPRIKEPAFFDTHYDKGLAWYDHLYAPLADAVACARVDFSNLYYLDPQALERIAAYNPQAKIVIIERNHADLFRSMLYFELRKGRDLAEIRALADRKYHASDCSLHIDRLREYFAERLVVIPFELIEQKNLHQIYDLLGLPDLPVVSSNFINAKMVPRARVLARLSKLLALWLREHEWFGLLQQLKRSQRLRSILFRQGAAFQPVPEIEALVDQYFGSKP
ncbi:MAG: sulfotransferase domain-containing protein [Alphaproteobacteria bacterium]|nr:sulfotransferase domain-containing protein [Alphaproteobacteria bacterium]